ncbi:hypothetical protein CN689_21725 [Peribacillus butanolivorans]|uniref:HTH-type transcriptional regulatory protein TyrR n=1 Tax=Peribacillus butanolivorans TaxID=421767 RepID=A0AAX0RXP4_9BACI|nr:sigma 54-interacting transcriptional regulator [Peribacillus butanolivorans]PEJ29785.1 hypothetical protein CN689_21725 [Peribacillus butanolivorans]
MNDLDLFSDSRFLTFLDQLSISVFIADREGEVIWNNKCSEDGIGIKREILKGQNVWDLEKKGVFTPSIIRLALENKKSVIRVQTVKNQKQQIATGNLIYGAEGQIELAVALGQPLDKAIKDIVQFQELEQLLQQYSTEIKKLRINHVQQKSPDSFIGKSKAMEYVMEYVNRIADVPATVLLTGETGVGKSVIARLIHTMSIRKNHPFISVNCGSIPESLLESELFGYEKGAFTGAKQSGKIGLVKAAEGGTLFLDEIGELPLNMQSKILQLLQDKTYLSIGSTTHQTANIRIIAATNRLLEHMIEERRFREDLYYRLSVFPLKVPALKERREDIDKMIYFFVDKFNEEYVKNCKISNQAVETMVQYDWPGNIRELENTIERLVVFSSEKPITPNELPASIRNKKELQSSLSLQLLETESLNELLDKVEKEFILKTMREQPTTRQAAKALGISQSTLIRRLQKYKE